MRYLIVGIDPGTTTAISALDLQGKVVKVVSGRDWGISRVIDIISKLGRPVLIATDRARAPAFVEKVAARFKAKVVQPRRDITTSEKRMIKEFSGHERDAFAAALRAYSAYETMFRKVERSIPEARWEAVKRKLILEEAINRADAMAEKAEKKMTETKKKERVEDAEKELGILKAENRALKDRISDMEKTRTRVVRHITDESLKRLADARLETINTLRKKLFSLETEIERLKAVISVWEMGGIPLENAGKIEGVEIRESHGVKFVPHEQFAKVEKERAKSLLKKVVESHRSKSS